MGVYDLTIYSIIERNAGVHADQVGWVSDNEEVTHLQFLKTVNRVAKYIDFVAQLPKTNQGLIDREKVKATFG